MTGQNSASRWAKTRLRGRGAREYIANAPKLLVACRAAGKNQAWQRALAFTKVGYSVVAGVDFTFKVTTPALAGFPEKAHTLTLFDVLAEAGAERGAALAAIADLKHASGGVRAYKRAVPKWFMEAWRSQIAPDDSRFEESDTPKLTPEAQQSLARSVFEYRPANRRRPIAEKFGVSEK